MKSKVKSIIMLTVIILSTTSFNYAQEKANGSEKATIKTSAVCGMCEKTIEDALNKQEGVLTAELNVKTAEVTVTYDSDKTTLDDVRKTISMIGYDADEMPADKTAYDALHGCCKKPE